MWKHDMLEGRLFGVRARHLTLALALMATERIAIAAWPANVTPTEIALSSPFCAYIRSEKHFSGNLSPTGRGWQSVLGSGFLHIHHYCYGQVYLQRAMRYGNSPAERKFLLTSALGEFQYVVRNSKSDFVLLPEIYTRMGDVQLLLSLPKDANESFARARAIKPDYWPGYSHWTEFLIRSGKRSEAKQLVIEGLKYSPKSKPLAQQYRELKDNSPEMVPGGKEEKRIGEAIEGTVPEIPEIQTPHRSPIESPPNIGSNSRPAK